MAGAPRFKVYTFDGEYIAATKRPEEAAAVLAINTCGTIRDGHRRVVYTDGLDGNAYDSYDEVAEIVWRRCR